MMIFCVTKFSYKISGSRDLTEDTLLEILLRLPVKSLVRFKCVCKQWYAIVESRSFIDQHFGHMSNKERLLVRHFKDNCPRYAYALFVDDNCSEFKEPAHLQMPDMTCDLMGPVNGVFCLVGPSGKLALLNPAMRQLKPLPIIPEVIVEPHLSFSGYVRGFGFDPLSGDYKVVSILHFLDKRVNVPDYHLIFFIYNPRGDSWRKLKDVGCFKSSYMAHWSLCKTYLNGVYYWGMGINSRLKVYAILAFDMTTEKFQEIQVPDCLVSKYGHLTIHGDSIAVLSYELPWAGGCEVWVMEKVGSWNRVAVVGPYQPIGRPLCLWKDNELVIQTKTALLLLCNICTKKRQLTQARVKVDSSFSYKESLVSVKRGRDNCMLWDASQDIFTIAWPNED